MRVVHRQGDLVPGYQSTFFASTLMVTCECRIIRLPSFGVLSPAAPERDERPTRFDRLG